MRSATRRSAVPKTEGEGNGRALIELVHQLGVGVLLGLDRPERLDPPELAALPLAILRDALRTR